MADWLALLDYGTFEVTEDGRRIPIVGYAIAPGVTLLLAPGHSPGHLSLLVRLRESGPVLLAADAISREHELETGVNVGWAPETYR